MSTYAEYLKTRSTESSIFDAAKSGDLDSVIGYLNAGGDANMKNHQGNSILMLAAYYGYWEVCRLLIHAGADVNSTDASGSTILMGVSFKGHTDVASLLIQNGAHIQAVNHAGQNAAMYAELFGRNEVLNLLRGVGTSSRKIHWYQQAAMAFRILVQTFVSKLKGAHHV